MKEATSSHAKAREVLTAYLERNGRRKTPERYAILDAIYTFDDHFSIDDLNARMVSRSFGVSKCTLYNTLVLMKTLRLVTTERFRGRLRFKAGTMDNRITCVCQTCGQEIDVPLSNASLADAVSKVRTPRFDKKEFTLLCNGECYK